MSCKFLIVVFIFMQSTSLFARDQKKSAEYRSEKSLALVWRVPTLTIIDSGLGSGETGFGFEAFSSEQVSYFLNVQTGYAGNIGTFAGGGSASRITAGYKRFFGNSFYLSPGIGVRHLNVGTVERRENKDYNSYDERDYNAEIYRNVATSIGAHLGTGWQWQRNRLAFGVEITTFFLPLANVYTSYSTSDEIYKDRAKKNAKNLGLLFDSSIPRFVIGFGF
jgi:hypothetical protein